MKVDLQGYTDIGGRIENEDCPGYRKHGPNVTAVIADGLGGQGDGGDASRSVCKSLLRDEPKNTLMTREEILALFDEANRELISQQKNSFHMKTTAVFLCIADNKAVWAHIGDSRLYHLFNGSIIHYTLDHSASQLAVYMGKITRDEIPGDAGRSRLLHAMGIENEVPDIHDPITLDAGTHVFLLCSDGLWEYLSDKEIESAWNGTKTADSFIEALRKIKAAKSPPDCDNNSAVVVHLEV